MLRFGKQTLSLLPVLLALVTVLGNSPALANEKYAGIVYDVTSGRTLYQDNADARRFPASLTKMMTLFVLFEELEAGRLKLDSRLSVSANAAKQAPSKVGVRAGSTIKVEDAILALTTKSANDVAVVIAENIGGSVSGFADRMNRSARAIGMQASTFRNPHGLPNSAQTATARDFVKLAIALQDRFPTYYKFFGARSFTYKGVRHRNHNRLLGSVAGVDGIKTGYTRASGFNLVTNVRRDGRHVVAVVMGGRTAASRDAHMRELIAKYLPQAKRGKRTSETVVADMVSSDAPKPAEVRAPAPPPSAATTALADIRTPRPRPGDEAEPALAYAANPRPRDLVAAAMAQPAPRPAPPPAQAVAPRPAAIQTAPGPVDPIVERISGANQIAALAYAPSDRSDPIARLTELARKRAANLAPSGVPQASPKDPIAVAAMAPVPDMIAAPRAIPAGVPAADEAGWHVQIGAVPTEHAAAELLENAQASLGPVLASLEPFTQPVEKNGTTLYRARFAGLSDKEEARAVCAKLESKSINCLAVPN